MDLLCDDILYLIFEYLTSREDMINISKKINALCEYESDTLWKRYYKSRYGTSHYRNEYKYLHSLVFYCDRFGIESAGNLFIIVLINTTH